MNKKISDMSDEELLNEIERMRAVPVPNAPAKPRRPQRLDEVQRKKKNSLFDQLEEE